MAADDGTVTLKPETSASGGMAQAQVSGSDAQAMVRAAEDGGAQIVIEPQVDDGAQAVQIALSKQAASILTRDGDSALTVRTQAADVTLSAQALGEAAGQAERGITIQTAEADGVLRVEVAADGRVLDQIAGGLDVRVPAQAGPGTVAVLVREDGTEEVVKKSVPTDGGLAIPLEGSANIRVEDRAKTFADMGEHWGAEAAAFVSARNILNGTSEDSFSPDAPMTRGMLVTALFRLEDEPAAAAEPFPDVDGAAYYAPAVAWARDRQIVAGLENGAFGPELPITREQLAVIFYHYACPDACALPEAPDTLSAFRDGAGVSDWARDGMRYAVAAGLLTGKEGGALEPQGVATRAEAALVIERLLTGAR